VGWLWRALAAIIVGARYLILVAWIAAAAAATLYLPPLATSSGVGGLIPSGAPALRASYDAARIFGLPLTAQVAVVQRDPPAISAGDAEARRAAGRRLGHRPRRPDTRAGRRRAGDEHRGRVPRLTGALDHDHHVPVLPPGHLDRGADRRGPGLRAPLWAGWRGRG